jgi:Tfp pilus assembly protein PilN
MMRIALDYSVDSSRLSFWRLGSILIAAAVLIGLGWDAYQLKTQLQGLEILVLERQRAATPSRPVTSNEQAANDNRIVEANRLLAELGVPWNRLFSSLEATASTKITILEIKPDAAKGRLRVSGEAQDMAALMSYVRTLEALDTLRDVSIQEHKAFANQAQQTVAFRLQAVWETQL